MLNAVYSVDVIAVPSKLQQWLTIMHLQWIKPASVWNVPLVVLSLPTTSNRWSHSVDHRCLLRTTKWGKLCRGNWPLVWYQWLDSQPNWFGHELEHAMTFPFPKCGKFDFIDCDSRKFDWEKPGWYLPVEHQGRTDAFPSQGVKFHRRPIANFDRPYRNVGNWAELVNLNRRIFISFWFWVVWWMFNERIIDDKLPYWQAETLNMPCGAHGGPCGQKHILSGLFSTDANTFSDGVNR